MNILRAIKEIVLSFVLAIFFVAVIFATVIALYGKPNFDPNKTLEPTPSIQIEKAVLRAT